MSVTTFNQLITEIKSRKFRPLYFLEGEEPYFIDRVADLIENTLLTDAEKSFNQQIVYGKEVSMLDILTSARRFPMMAEHQLILVREAQHLKNIDELIGYLSNKVPTTVLVFLYKGKRVNKNTKLGKALKNYGLLTTRKLYDNEMSAWVMSHVKSMELDIEPRAVQLILHASGNNLMNVTNELEKIHANLGDRTKMLVDDVSNHTGLSKEYNVFELTKSIGERNRLRSLQIVQFFETNPKENPFVLILTNIFNYFKKIHLVHFSKSQGNSQLARELGLNPYFIGEYTAAARHYSPREMTRVFKLIHEFDLRSKGMSGGHTNQNELLTELIVRMIN
jgi:DNA polymerase III subunit delta